MFQSVPKKRNSFPTIPVFSEAVIIPFISNCSNQFSLSYSLLSNIKPSSAYITKFGGVEVTSNAKVASKGDSGNPCGTPFLFITGILFVKF